MNNLKASQRTTRRDVPSARRLPEAKALAPDPKDRPSGVCRTKPEGETPAREGKTGRDENEEADSESSR